jgi:hypothetical protein
MPLFQLDPESIAARVRAEGGASKVPTLGESILRGSIGFMLVSVAGFMPWAASEFWFRWMGEMAMYAASVIVFIGTSGICLHRLVIGPGALVRFYKLFTLAFVAYAAAWIGVWVWLRGDAGAYGGLFAGAAAMGVVLAIGFGVVRGAVPIVVALFVPQFLGYLAGEWIAGKFGFEHRLAAMLGWGALYGIGFGAGIGLAFYLCQIRVRAAFDR